MKKIDGVPWIIVVALIIMCFITNMMGGVIPATILGVSYVLSIYFCKFMDYKAFSLSRHNVQFEFDSWGIPRIKFKDVKILRELAAPYIWASRFFAVYIFVYIACMLHFLFKIGDLYVIFLPILGIFLSLIFPYHTDLVAFCTIKFSLKHSFYVDFMDNGIKMIIEENVLRVHKDIYFYELIYNQYSKEDLLRESILIEQEMLDDAKVRYFDKYFMPFFGFVYITTIGLMIGAQDLFDLNKGNISIFYLSIFFVFVLVWVVISIGYWYNKTPKPKLIIRKMVVGNLLQQMDRVSPDAQ